MSRALAVALIAAAAACGRDAPAPPPPVAEPPVAEPPSVPRPPGASLTAERKAEAEALLVRFECTRCHAGPKVADISFDAHCVDCHRELVVDKALFDVPEADLISWRSHVRSLLAVPSLFRVGPLLRREWVAGFLLHPTDVRPHLPASMPRLAIAPAEAALLAEYLVPDEALTAPAGGDPAHGRALYGELGCGTCHALAGMPAAPPPLEWNSPSNESAVTTAHDAYRLAPDLSRAAARLQPGRVVAWLRSPTSLVPGTLMPALVTDERNARDLAAFLLAVPPPPPAAAPAPEPRLPLLTREVTFAEVSERVFRKVCWHCHSAPFYAKGDGGPGNTGGFGFKPRGLDLSSHEGLMIGARGDDGRRRSIFAREPDGTPRVIAVMMARRLEERGGEVPAIRGMPLGLPAMALEDIQLVETWIDQGRAE